MTSSPSPRRGRTPRRTRSRRRRSRRTARSCWSTSISTGWEPSVDEMRMTRRVTGRRAAATAPVASRA
ncbi:DUF1651 domain-containing protein [uncultured Microbacterium sp.]|uniref:DUF1651 domain-containing protein n=1 Tax=uncultured Microbacterium sp. TaxID=191216 RepID=UPI00345994D9